MNLFKQEVLLKASSWTEQLESKLISNKIPSNDRFLSILDELELLKEQIISWRTLAEKQVEELELIEEELIYTNEELCKAFMFQKKSLVEVKELAKTILSTGKSAKDCLAELIATIYDCSVNSEELEAIVSHKNCHLKFVQ